MRESREDEGRGIARWGKSLKADRLNTIRLVIGREMEGARGLRLKEAICDRAWKKGAAFYAKNANRSWPRAADAASV